MEIVLYKFAVDSTLRVILVLSVPDHPKYVHLLSECKGMTAPWGGVVGWVVTILQVFTLSYFYNGCSFIYSGLFVQKPIFH